MRECIKCGASLYRDADPFCEHDFGEAPEPEYVSEYVLRGETSHVASGLVAGLLLVASHPTREGAVALWKERWRWGPAIQALFGWLLGRPSAFVPMSAYYETQDDLAAAIDDEIKTLVVGLEPVGTVSEEVAVEQTVEGALEILREMGSAIVSAGGRRFEVSIVSAFNAAFAIRWVTPGPNGELHAVVCVGWRELTDTLRDAVAGRGVFAPPSQPLVPAPTVEQVKLARVLANLREHGRARFMALLATDGRYYEYSVERYSTGRSGYSIERHGHPGLLRFSGAEVPVPLIDAINTALSGGDPFASADGDEAFRGVARALVTERALRKHAAEFLGRHTPQLLDDPDHGGRTVTVNQEVDRGQLITTAMIERAREPMAKGFWYRHEACSSCGRHDRWTRPGSTFVCSCEEADHA